MDWRYRRYFTITINSSTDSRYREITKYLQTIPSCKLHSYLYCRNGMVWSKKNGRYEKIAKHDERKWYYHYTISIKRDDNVDKYINRIRHRQCSVHEIIEPA